MIDVPLVRHLPHACQTENWLLHDEYYWTRIQQIGWGELLAFVQNPATLWINGQKTYHGQNDRIEQEAADGLPDSLCLIHVTELDLRVHAPSEAFGNPKRKVRARFQHRGIRYALQVTDPNIEREYLAMDNGLYSLGESALTISLSEPFNGFRYKLVAAIIQRAGISP